MKIDPHKSLRYANEKFKKRFFIIEKILGDKIFNQSNQKFQELWTLAKKQIAKNKQNDKK